MHDAGSLPTLYVHTKKPEWGLAIIARDGRDKRRFLFQDGQTRAFPLRFSHFMQPANKPADVTERVARLLSEQLDGVPWTPTPAARRKARVPFESQIAVFKLQYAGGFADPNYIKQVRGAEKRRKRHRDPAIEDANELLSAERLDAHIEAGEFATVVELAREVLNRTSLCSTRDRQTLRDLPEDRFEAYAQSLRDLLHSEAPLFDRFTRYMASLDGTPGGAPTWPLVTSLLALADPKNHVVVKPSVFRKQAELIEPNLSYNALPNAGLYTRFQEIAQDVFNRLHAADMQPRDLFDIYEFIWMTLRPKALEMMNLPR